MRLSKVDWWRKLYVNQILYPLMPAVSPANTPSKHKHKQGQLNVSMEYLVEQVRQNYNFFKHCRHWIIPQTVLVGKFKSFLLL